MFCGLRSLLEESNRKPFSSNREHTWLKISLLALQSALLGLRWTFSKLNELHAFIVFAELKIFHFHCVVFLTAAVTKELRQKPPHRRNKLFWSFEPNLSASHSTSSSSVKLLLQLNFCLYLNVCLYRIGEAFELSPVKLVWKSGTPCLLIWWKTCIIVHLNVYQV